MAGQYLAQTQTQRLQMVLAPQLRQSLEMLQVPALELRALVQQEIQKNPTLEEKVQENEPVEVEPGTTETDKERDAQFEDEFRVLAQLDDEWRDYFRQSQTFQPYTADDAAKRQYFLDSLTRTESLQEHLLSQLALAALETEDHRVAELIIGSITDDGYLATPLADLAHSTGHELHQMESMLLLIQEFDPIGVGARDLRECLQLQLERVGMADSPAALVVRDHLDELGAKKFGAIAKALKITPEEAQDLARFIATLEPKPGRLFSAESPSYVLPEVMLQKVAGEYVISLNRDYIPHLRISKHYRQLMESPETTQDVKDYIRDKIRSSAFLIKSIAQRQQTIHRIATEIVKVQKDFLDHGVSHLRPLTMAQVANVLGIHETTVSRAISNKYMQTPGGMFELKYFFTPGFKTSDGKEISNKTIKDAIAQLVANEDPTNPLSDQTMVEKLREEGITVARRTIAKYRDELKILPSHLRKQL